MRRGLVIGLVLAGCGRTEPWDRAGEGGPGADAGEGGPDAGRDAGPDAGLDAGFDAGFDAGPPCSSDADCDDGVFCDGAETCRGSLCMPGSPIVCNDGVACTDDRCDEGTRSCRSAPVDARCDDGLFCTGTETCDARTGCLDGRDPACGDRVACTVDACDEALDRCTNTPSDALCDDGLVCNGAETCDAAGGCFDGSNLDCDDGIACTDDACTERAGGCTHAAVDARCDDGLFCNGTETCDTARGCTDGADPDCDDGVDCTDDACDERADLCVSTPDDGACDDRRFCNGEEICDAALGCMDGTAVDCTDAFDCTLDFCIDFFGRCFNVPLDFLCGAGQSCDPDAGCV
jgi:hypothetical protein